MSDSLLSYGLQPTRLWSPWDSPGARPDPGIKPASLLQPALAGSSLPLAPPGKPTHVMCSIAKSCLTLRDPMDYSMPGIPVLHSLPESAQIHAHWASDAIQPSHSLLSPSPPAFNLSQHQGLFQRVGSSHQKAKVSGGHLGAHPLKCAGKLLCSQTVCRHLLSYRLSSKLCSCYCSMILTLCTR